MSLAVCFTISVLLPILGAVVAVLCTNRSMARSVALTTSVITLGLVMVVAVQGRSTIMSGAMIDGANVSWSGPASGWDIRFSLGLDGISYWLYALSAVLMMTSVLVSWDAIEDRPGLFYCMLLLLESGCLGVFSARDVILFYVFFEFTLIPLFFLIGIWGSEDRRYAAIKFFLFTLTGSVLTFLGLLSLVLWAHAHGDGRSLSFSMAYLQEQLAAHPMYATHPQLELWVFLALFAGFAIKVPLFPLHTWLPLAHVQAPTAGSVFLAGILLKIGTYGFLRFSLPLLPQASLICLPWILILAAIGIVYGALVALIQEDMKRLVAYSSVSHLGYCMLGLFAMNSMGLQGSVLQMVNHGISTGALFALIGMAYERFHTRRIDQLAGLAGPMPWFAFFLILFTFSSIGVPGLNGFAGEFLVLVGVFYRGWVESPAEVAWTMRCVSIVALLGVILGAWYMLWFVRRVLFGELRTPHGNEGLVDLKWREIAALAPLAVLVVWIGVMPNWFLQIIAPSVNGQMRHLEASISAAADHHQANALHLAEDRVP